MSVSRLGELRADEIEVVNEAVLGRQFACVVFDFDGTISLLREDWPSVMSQMMLEVVSGDSRATVEIRRDVEEYVRQSAGLATIDQMRHLVVMARKHGRVPDSAILSAEEYKKVYDERLLQVVDRQLAMLRDGRVANRDLTVPGILEFLDWLKRRRIPLYVASTTDREYLLREAAALEVSGYFEAIHAPEPSLPEYSKEWLVLSVLEWQHLDPGQLLTIGDGQVEIAVTKKHGGFAMGVASSEKRDGCFNREKLKMLVNAGADMVVPDFRNHRVLTGCLFDGVL